MAGNVSLDDLVSIQKILGCNQVLAYREKVSLRSGIVVAYAIRRGYSTLESTSSLLRGSSHWVGLLKSIPFVWINSVQLCYFLCLSVLRKFNSFPNKKMINKSLFSLEDSRKANNFFRSTSNIIQPIFFQNIVVQKSGSSTSNIYGCRGVIKSSKFVFHHKIGTMLAVLNFCL